MDISTIIQAYQSAKRRLLLLDYDGVLVPIMPKPELASPTPQTLSILGKLTADPRNTCVVISGRPRETLDNWLGDVPVALAAEHGLWRREIGSDWTFAAKVGTSWKSKLKAEMSQAVARLPGAFIEEKYAVLTLHYRGVSNADDEIQALIAHLNPIAEVYDLYVLHGKKVLEVLPKGVDKGTAGLFWLNGAYDFILGAGDDTTDEALFNVMPESAYSIKVGTMPSAARYNVPTQKEFMDLLLSIFNANGRIMKKKMV